MKLKKNFWPIMGLFLILFTFSLYSEDANSPRQSIYYKQIKDLGDKSQDELVVLLDFTTYEEKIKNQDFSGYPADDPSWVRDDKGLVASGTLPIVDSVVQHPMYRITQSDMLLDKWEVILCPSADKPMNNQLSMCKKITTTENESVLGIRVNFPNDAHNYSAVVAPPFQISSFTQYGHLANQNNGIINNVGAIRWISMEVNGRNYPCELYIRLKDENDRLYRYRLGTLNYIGWQELRWDNPEFVMSAVHQQGKQGFPLYPHLIPFFRFDGFEIQKIGPTPSNDCILYIKNIKMDYDWAIAPSKIPSTIDDEAWWGIYAKETREDVRESIFFFTEKLEELRLENEWKQAAIKTENLLMNNGNHDTTLPDGQ